MKYFFRFQNRLSPKIKKIISLKLTNELKTTLSSLQINSQQEYNNVLKLIMQIIKKYPITIKSPLYADQLLPIKSHSSLTEETTWGGVVLKKVDVAKDFIQKLLVINKNGILGFEIHKEKYEKLRVLEGIVLFLHSNHKDSNWKKREISVKIAGEGERLDLPPFDEHGMIALTNCVIRETSTNHLDDLTYIFTSSYESNL